MWDFIIVLTLALLPAAGNTIGNVLAEGMHTPKWLVGAALHAAAGITIALVSIDLMPRILESISSWVMAVAFLCGAAISVVLVQGARALQFRLGTGSAGAWMVQLAIIVDLASDGLMTGAGSGISLGLGLLLALAQLVANIPGGFATTANFRDKGTGKRERLIIMALVPVFAVISAGLGFGLLKGADVGLQHGVLAVMVGVLLLTTVEETLPQGDAPQPPRWISTTAFAGGFALFALMSSIVGGSLDR